MNTTDEPAAGEPTLSVIIPVYNDLDGIRLTLESVTGQTYPTDEYEVLAVDNGSTDSTRDIIETYCERYPDLVTLLVEDEIQGSYAARNEGIRNARGSIIAFIDADMTVRADWLESLVASHREHGWDYAGCEMAMYTEHETWTARYDTFLRGFPVERYLHERNFVQTGCLTTTKEVFDAVGLFDARIASHGDEEFGKRVHEAGFNQHFESSITMYHPAREALRPWLKKQFRIGRGAVELQRYHPENAESAHPLHPRQFLPLQPRDFYARLTDATDPTPRETGIFYALDYASKLARAAGSLYEQYCTTPHESTN
ncbi:glycosyltransferase, type 2 [Halococcus morrhuae DSM 1307]|uniref:Glycosyltransferase, type 2 n=1 Tax=Halococcus morrhuae DSM 1307 TaxID=931277 RepID=M0M2M4_HALMO|nr:glycosyltransferase [Halococcus morrhuae]EMA39643.1 glycosyltransferase, type 2 [Halococcus morrhuae DSM 1307]